MSTYSAELYYKGSAKMIARVKSDRNVWRTTK